VTKRGRHIGMTECEVTDEQGRLVAKASATQMTLRGELAAGR
jgi:acyl-coenzyme A thioesterase PaaI-like protein